jgi:hypothetical protein
MVVLMRIQISWDRTSDWLIITVVSVSFLTETKIFSEEPVTIYQLTRHHVSYDVVFKANVLTYV